VACGGLVDGIRLLSPKTIDRIFAKQFNGIDLEIGIPIKWGVGYGLTARVRPRSGSGMPRQGGRCSRSRGTA